VLGQAFRNIDYEPNRWETWAYDLSVKNLVGGEEVKHRSPQPIMEKIAALDVENAEVSAHINALL
jgi:hypothetical protein